MHDTLSSNPLFRALPGLEAQIPWLPLGDWPTAVERVAGVAGGFTGELWVKRDDRSSPLYGGNKVRKLEYLVAAARAEGHRRLITSGVEASHHCLATAVHGRLAGLPTTLVVFPQPDTPHAREIAALNRAWADEVRRCSSWATLPFAEIAARLRRRRDHPYVIPGGGSSPLGVLGHVGGALELAEQVAGGVAPQADRITVAAGTLGTISGLAIGCALAPAVGLPAPAGVITGVRIVPGTVANARRLRALVDGGLRLLEGGGVDLPSADEVLARVELVDDWFGAGYGHPTEAGDRATAWFAERSIELDPTYTAKTAAALLSLMEREPTAVHLYWHTLSSTLPPASVAV